MRCEELESKLPAYMENDLDAEAAVIVERHLGVCGSCLRSLRALESLEEILHDLRQDVPPAGRFLGAVIQSSGRSRLRKAVDFIFDVPVTASLLFAAAGVILFFFRNGMNTIDGGMSRMFDLTLSASNQMAQSIADAANSDVWILNLVWLSLSALFYLATSLAALDYLNNSD